MRNVFYGWWILLVTCTIHFVGSGTFFHSFTAFFNPIFDEFGWSYAAISLAASLRSIEGGIAAPIVGFAVDRYGARRLILIGSIISGLGFIFFSRITALWSFYASFLFISIGSSLFFPLPGFAVVANWFQRNRGIAFGLLSAAVGAGGVWVYVVNGLIGRFGWRASLVFLGVVTWMVGIPCALLVRNSPEPYGLLPDGDVPLSTEKTLAGENATEMQGKEFGLREAIRTRSFWFLAAVTTTSASGLHAVAVHVMPCLISLRFSREIASVVASLVIILSISGRLGFGWLGNRFAKKHLLAVGLLLQALGLFFLADARSLWHVLLFTLFYAMGSGGVITLRLTIQADYFGRKAYGAIQGLVIGIMILGTICSTYLSGLVYDLSGRYTWAWITMALLMLASIPFALWTNPPRKAEARTVA